MRTRRASRRIAPIKLFQGGPLAAQRRHFDQFYAAYGPPPSNAGSRRTLKLDPRSKSQIWHTVWFEAPTVQLSVSHPCTPPWRALCLTTVLGNTGRS